MRFAVVVLRVLLDPRVERIRQHLALAKEWILNTPAHWFTKTVIVAYVLAVFWTSLAYAYENRFTATRSASSSALSKLPSDPHERLRIQAYLDRAAKTRGVDPQVAEWIVAHESRHHPEAIGDGGASRGLWQINKAWHPEVSDACAYNVSCSTNWSLGRIRAGHVDEWSTWKYCKERFNDCPADSK
jgi:hypothetical protein